MFSDTGRLLKVALAGWWNDRAMSLGASIAFFTVFSLAPMLLAAIAVAGLAFGREAAQGAIVGELGGLIGTNEASALETMIASASNVGSGIVGTTIGIVTFLLLVTGAVVELQDDLNIIWKAKPPASYGVMSFVRTRLVSFALVLGIGFLLLVSLVIDTGLTAVGHYLEANFSGATIILRFLNNLVSFAVAAVSVRDDLQDPAGRRHHLEGRFHGGPGDSSPVHIRQVPDRVLSRQEQCRLELRRGCLHHHHPALDLLLIPHPTVRRGIHESLCGKPRQLGPRTHSSLMNGKRARISRPVPFIAPVKACNAYSAA